MEAATETDTETEIKLPAHASPIEIRNVHFLVQPAAAAAAAPAAAAARGIFKLRFSRTQNVKTIKRAKWRGEILK